MILSDDGIHNCSHRDHGDRSLPHPRLVRYDLEFLERSRENDAEHRHGWQCLVWTIETTFFLPTKVVDPLGRDVLVPPTWQ